jgi:hypothetical protein
LRKHRIVKEDLNLTILRIFKKLKRRVVRMAKRKNTSNIDEIKEWLLKKHEMKEWYFHEIKHEYEKASKYKLTSDDKFNLSFAIQELINEKRLGFREGKTYLIEKV